MFGLEGVGILNYPLSRLQSADTLGAYITVSVQGLWGWTVR